VLYGNDPATPNGQMIRGQRVFCSPRGRRGGCGHTFCLFLAPVLPRHSFSATGLWALLVRWLAGASVPSAAQSLRLPFALESVYHLLSRLRERLHVLRGCLCRRRPPPESSQRDPLRQTLAHLQRLFPDAVCPVSEFQLAFQQPFLG
jgi:hypothetical protein